MTYQIVNNPMDGEIACIRLTNGNQVKLIPLDPANVDYQKYLAWVAEGNEPLPADSEE